MKIVFLYVLLNVLLYPVVIMFMFVGFMGGALTNGNIGFGDVIWLYLIALLPNALLLATVHFWGERWHLSKKLNLFMFLVAAFVLAFFLIREPLDIQNIFG